MLRMVVSSNAEGATKYFTDALSVGDYYAEGQTCYGVWHGKGAELLGLTGPGRSGLVEQDEFRAMAQNRHPTKGGPLTERTVGNRRVGYDVNFHAPKSVSVVHALTQDPRILEAFRSAVNETMERMEREMKCRVRVGGAQEDRAVGNLCWGEFVHFTARPVGGRPDPHLHAHCFTFNAVHDAVEDKWKAGQFGDLKRDAPFFEACFHAKLASGLVELGYEIERRGKSWEIASVPKSVVETFSRRTAEIEAKAEELGIRDAKRKDGLGAKTRARKNDARPIDELREEWSKLVDPAVRESMLSPRVGPGSFGHGIERSSDSAVSLAASTTFERHSVVTERKLVTAAVRNALGSVSVEELEAKLRVDDHRFVRRELDGVPMVTTREVMAEEQRMIDFAQDGRGVCPPLAYGHKIVDERLNDQQRAAVEGVLNSTNRVTLVQGGAGTGKTTLLREVLVGALAQRKGDADPDRDPITFLAPSADASRGVLRGEGFAGADTVAMFLVSEKMQERARDGVLWVDESGLLGSRTMAALCEKAKELGARVFLSGDPRQHRAVERGDPLGLLEEHAGVEPIGVDKVLRQRGLYKSAVEHLAKGEAAKGFEGLRKMGSIREMAEEEAHREIAYNYANHVERGRSALVVSPTHAEARSVTEHVREELKRRGLVTGEARTYDRLEDLRLTEGEKTRAYSYEAGHVVQFHQNVRGFRAGQRYVVTGERDPAAGGVLLDNGQVLPLDKGAAFNVYRRHERSVELCVGDTVRITANGKSHVDDEDGGGKHAGQRPHALNNGATYRVAGFTDDGHVRLGNGWTVARDYGHLTHGYCSTSHSSQGKTVDTVFVAQSTNSFPASSAEQFYVSVSRGRHECVVYTDDVPGLRDRVAERSERISAVELSDDVHWEKQRAERMRAAAREFEEEWQQFHGPKVDRERERGRERER